MIKQHYFLESKTGMEQIDEHTCIPLSPGSPASPGVPLGPATPEGPWGPVSPCAPGMFYCKLDRKMFET